MQPQPLARPVRVVTRRFKRAQMHLLPRRRHCVRRLNLKIAAVQKETPDRSGQSRASTEERQTVGKTFGMPSGTSHSSGHAAIFTGAPTLPPDCHKTDTPEPRFVTT